MNRNKYTYDPRPFFEKLAKNPEFKRAEQKLNERFALASIIRNARERAGLTQKELAEKVGTKQSAISRIESGVYKHAPSVSFLYKVATACGAHLGITFEFKKAS